MVSQCASKRFYCAIFIAQLSHYGKFTALHKLTSIALLMNLFIVLIMNQISKKFPLNDAVPGLFFKNCSGDEVGKINVLVKGNRDREPPLKVTRNRINGGVVG